MKKELDEFYKANEPAFGMLGVLLITTGLVLNVPSSTGLIGKAIEHLKFLFLVISALLLIHLIFMALQRAWNTKYFTGQGTTFYHQVRRTTIRLFFISLAFLISVDLLIFIFSSYLHEAIYLLVVLVALFIIVQLSKIPMEKNGISHTWHIFIITAVVAVIVSGYVFLYTTNTALMGYALLFFLTLAVIISFIVNIRSKKNLMGEKNTPSQPTGLPIQNEKQP